MASVLATIKTFVCSVCDKAFGAYSSCAKRTRSCKFNLCRSKGATIKPVTNIVSLNDRNVGGRVPPAVAAQPVRDSEINEITGGGDHSDDGDGAAELEPESSGSISCHIPSYP